MRALLATGLALALLLVAAPSALAVGLPPGFRDTTVLSGISEPTSFRIAPDGRVFVAEKSGLILVYENFSDPIPEVFADLQAQVYDRGDRGLMAIELDPEFPAQPYLYALYTYNHVLGEPSRPTPAWHDSDSFGEACELPEGVEGVDTCPVSGRLVRLEVVGDEAGEERVLVEGWCQQDSSHSMGDLGFGPEGALYASAGDGASFVNRDWGQYGWPHVNQCGDWPGSLAEVEAGTTFPLEPPLAEGGALRAQDARTPGDPTALNAALLRVDPETGEGMPDNPMAASSDPNRRRIVAYGFRNPFRFAVDGQTGSVYVSNVGWIDVEEMDRVPLVPSQPYNSGWPCYEGDAKQAGYAAAELDICEGLYAEPGSTSLPFFHYDHIASVAPGDECPIGDGSAIAGIAPYHGSLFPAQYHDALFFADTVRGCIYMMPADGEGEPDPSRVEPFLTEGSPYPAIDLIEGPEGALYYSSLYTPGYGPGAIHKIGFDPAAPEAKLSADTASGATPLEVTFDAGESSPSEESGTEGELEFEWDLDGNGSFETASGTTATETGTYEGTANVTVAVRVTDKGTGVQSVAELTVYPGDEPPEVDIFEPGDGQTWAVGQDIEFAGDATEFGGEPVKWTNLYWKTRILHCPFGGGCHRHPLQVFPATDGGELVAPEHDYPSSIELSLTATDERGLSNTETVTLAARPVKVTLDSTPAGVDLTAGSFDEAAPYSFEAIEGSTIQLLAPKKVTVDGVEYPFLEWSDGGARIHSVFPHEATAYRALYDIPEAESPTPTPPAPTPTKVRKVPRPALRKRPASKTHRQAARFAFVATGASGLSFHCRLDGHAARNCRSPLVIHHLSVGRHKLKIWAMDGDGRRGKARVFRWHVLPRRHLANRAGHSRG